jgi:lipopolysaccharide export system permease protein
MLNRLDRYVISSVLGLTAIVALGLTAIYTIVTFVSDINETGKGDYGVVDVVQYSLLMIPSSLYTLMPVIALLGTLLGIGALARNSELTAMRAAGVSLARIGAAVMVAGAGLGAIGFVLGDWVAPASERLASALRDDARGEKAERSQWLRDGDNFVQIRQIDSEQHVRDLTVYRSAADGKLVEAVTVDKADYVDDHWQLMGVKRTSFQDDRTVVTQAAQETLVGGIKPNDLKLFILEAENLSVSGLLRLIDYMERNGLDPEKYRIWLWRKLVEPFTVMTMMLLAMPFVIGQLRDANAGAKLLIGALVGVVFYVTNKVSVSLGDLYGWPAPLAAGSPTAVLAIIASWRLFRAR